MTMVERIRTLLETRQLTPTQFADAIGVARPIVSHILSGRNKPSLEVVQRILAAMPDLSMPWLLNGTGPMLASSVAATPEVALPRSVDASVVPTATPTTTPIAATPEKVESLANSRRAAPYNPPAPRIVNQTKGPQRFRPLAAKSTSAAEMPSARPSVAPAAEMRTPDPISLPPTQQEIPIAPELNTPAQAKPVDAPTPNRQSAKESTAAALFAGAEKPIRRIVIFYRDGSFADYQPEPLSGQ